MKHRPIKLYLSLGILGIVLLITVLGPLIGPDPTFINPNLPTVGPSMGHPFGTDELGRDLFSRLAVGGQISLMIGLATALVAVVIGTAYGTLAAFFEGRSLDTLMMRVLDVLYSLPSVMIVILFTLFMNKTMAHVALSLTHLGFPDLRGLMNITGLVLALALFSWPDTARIIRGQVLSLKREEFVEAYYSLGGKPLRLVFSHFIPNLTALIILTATITVPRAILTESTLSFIGLGVSPPYSSWGTMINSGWQMIRIAPHLILLPGFFLFITMVALNLLGDSLKELLEPKSA